MGRRSRLASSSKLRVTPTTLLETCEEELIKDFKVRPRGNDSSLHNSLTDPLFSQMSGDKKPSFPVTSSLLWKELMRCPGMFLEKRKKNGTKVDEMIAVHIALLNVGGHVSEDDEILNLSAVARKV
ncbi:hypothetical protein BDZ45DRAFT_719646 [Acephala macrosclerotiorum]|nr:hypothetical protein BDZ45DRAFT_719646 [Acephala macrosclerotiorum]